MNNAMSIFRCQELVEFIMLFRSEFFHLRHCCHWSVVCLNVKCCILLHKSHSEALQRLEEVYGKAIMKKTQVDKWNAHFCDGHASVNDDPCCR
jgi:hypothetical protein